MLRINTKVLNIGAGNHGSKSESGKTIQLFHPFNAFTNCFHIPHKKYNYNLWDCSSHPMSLFI